MKMKTIYINNEYRCFVGNGTGRTAIETDVFDGKCDEYIEGMRFVPAGETWTRADGVVFTGEMVTPWRDSQELDQIQLDYERKQLSDALDAIDNLLVILGEQ